MTDFENICQWFKQKSAIDFVIPAGRANTLLYAFFKTLPENSTVLFPEIMCPSPLFVAELAGVEAQLCDVDMSTGLLDVNALKKTVLANPNQISAVLSVNLYGLRPNNHEIYDFCRANNIILIEDAAQGFDLNSLSRDVDFSILSFGTKKTLDLGGGGLLLTRNKVIFSHVIKELSKVVVTEPAMISKLSQDYSTLYYHFQEMETYRSGSQKCFAGFSSLFAELYFPAKDTLDFSLLLSRLRELPKDKEQRLLWVKRYNDLFAKMNDFILLDNLVNNGSYWRYSVLIAEDKRKGFTDYIRERGIDVSCWYTSLEKLGFNHRFMAPKQKNSFGESVLNFWLEDMTNEKFTYLERCIEDYIGSQYE
jgi:dTDP-4-amino-4,6-dideoxygalactose transaminase